MDLLQRDALLTRAQGDRGLQRDLMELCRRDKVFWFTTFCWTFNPRKKPYNFPFNLYPFQKQIVRSLETCVDEGEPLLLKKSRDMGVTWLIIGVFYHYWRFEEGSDFYCTSKTETDVDKKGAKSTIFEKIRYLHRMLPRWMRPEMGKNDDGFCKFVNPENGNSITGGAPVIDLGRSQRYKAALLDEMARLPYGQASYDSISQSTDCILMPYTPYGENNAAFQMASSPDVERLLLTVEDTPEETERTILLRL